MSTNLDTTLSTNVAQKGKLDKDEARFLNTVFDNLRSDLRKVQKQKKSKK